jgi:hypothetical protein
MSGRKTFVGGDILLASELNGFLMDQAVMVFDDAAARTTAIPSPSEGMVTYLKDTDSLWRYTTTWEQVSPIVGSILPAGTVLQVVYAEKTSAQVTGLAGGGTTAITGLSAVITPRATSSKILVHIDVTGSVATIGGVETGTGFGVIAKRNGSAVSVGDADGSRTRVSSNIAKNEGSSGFRMSSASFSFLDSPATTSALTYTVDILNTMVNSNTMYVNRQAVDDNASRTARGVSRITVMEVQG